ncbi:MAG TPA: hypothetical protein VFS21_08135 [Roseiflexaceae bacterium]|nr:hypothetical protein [Roseiflexaceae bacterium]
MLPFLLSILPDDLRERLRVSGAADDDGLASALEADSALRRDLEAFVRDNGEQVAQQLVWHLLPSFASIPNTDALWEFWQQVPDTIEEYFITAASAWAERAEQEGDSATASGLRARLDGLEEIRAQQRAQRAAVEAWVARLAVLEDLEQLPALWAEVPRQLEDTFLAAADARVDLAEQEGERRLAGRLRARLTRLRILQAAAVEMTERPPLDLALLAFIAAESDDAARRLFADQHELLGSPRAEATLADWSREAPPDLLARLQSRTVMLQELRREQGG